MSWPIDSVRKAVPVFFKIRTNQGSTSRRHQTKPAPGRNRASQRPDRSRRLRTRPANNGTMGVIGPLTRIPTATAVQNRAQRGHDSCRASVRVVQARARTAMAATTVAHSTASVLARWASTVSRITGAIRAAPSTAPRRVVSASPVQ